MEIKRNEQFNGIEIYFDGKPQADTIAQLKMNGFKWHSLKKCWYSVASDNNINFANGLLNGKAQPLQQENDKDKQESEQLKKLFYDEICKAWDTESMRKHCYNQAATIIEHNGNIYSIDKPTIKTDFCYGYGYNGLSDTKDEINANDMARTARTDQDYFITANLKPLNERIEELQNCVDELGLNWAEGSHPRYMVYVGKHYSGQPDDCKLNYFSICDSFNHPYGTPAPIELINKLIKGYEQVKQDFIKRLNAYLKRYGLTRVKSWSYLVD